jgi:hypothetical protein
MIRLHNNVVDFSEVGEMMNEDQLEVTLAY